MSDEKSKESINIPSQSEIEEFLSKGIHTPSFYETAQKYSEQLKVVNGVGRPTKYFPEYCFMLVDHMTMGFTYEAFAGLINVGVKTLYQWEQMFSEFSQAKEIGVSKARYTVEAMGLKAMSGQLENFVTTVWVFHMKNRFGWRDQPDDGGDNTQNNYESKIKIAIEMMRQEKLRIAGVMPKDPIDVSPEPKKEKIFTPRKKRPKKGEKAKLNEKQMFDSFHKKDSE